MKHREKGRGFLVYTSANSDDIEHRVDVESIATDAGINLSEDGRTSLRRAIISYWDQLFHAYQAPKSNDVWNRLSDLQVAARRLTNLLSSGDQTGEAARSWLEMENHRSGMAVDVDRIRSDIFRLARLANMTAKCLPAAGPGRKRAPGLDALIVSLREILEQQKLPPAGAQMVGLAQATLRHLRDLAYELYDPPESDLQMVLLQEIPNALDEEAIHQAIRRARERLG